MSTSFDPLDKEKKRASRLARRRNDDKTVEVVQKDRPNSKRETGSPAVRATEAPRFVQYILWLLAAAIWAPIGLLLWIPYVTRRLAGYLGAVVRTALVGGGIDVARMKLLDSAGFYRRGFHRVRTIREKPSLTEMPLSLEQEPREASNRKGLVWRVVIEILFALAFWGTVIFGTAFLFGGWEVLIAQVGAPV